MSRKIKQMLSLSDVEKAFVSNFFISNVMVYQLDNLHSEVDLVVFLGNENKTLETRN